MPPIYTSTELPLNPGQTTTVGPHVWTPPANGTFYVQVVADTTNVVPEVSEGNNCAALTISVGGFPDLVPVEVAVSGTPYTAPIDLVTGRTVELTARASNLGLVDTVAQSPTFTLIFLDTGTGGELANDTHTGGLAPGATTAATYAALWTAPLTPGSYVLRFSVDPWNVISEDVEDNNTFDVTFTVFDLVAPPDPTLTVLVGGDRLNWSEVPDAAAYNIYGGSDPLAVDFDSPLNSGPWDGPPFDHQPTSGEFYYVVTSLDARGWEGPTSTIVGRYAKDFPRGYSTFSLPLEPFGTLRAHDLVGGTELLRTQGDVIFEYDADRQDWRGHAAGMPERIANFALEMGRGYMLFLNDPGTYVFVGRPGADIRFLDFPGDPRLGASDADVNATGFQSSLILAADGANIQLTWTAAEDQSATLSPFETPDVYRVYRSERRGGPYVDIADVPGTEYTDLNVTAGEYYYYIVPVNGQGREGSSSYATGIMWFPLTRGYTAFGLPFPSAEVTVTDLMTGQDLTDPAVVFGYDVADQSWMGHTLRMPRGAVEFLVTHTEGYYVHIAELERDLTFVIIGR
jgi:hypothetical protein